MPGVNIPNGSFSNWALFSNWPPFERELREAFEATLDEQSVARVMTRVQRACAALQLPGLLGSIDLEHAAQVVRYEAWSKEFRAAQEQMLAVLIRSFVGTRSACARAALTGSFVRHIAHVSDGIPASLFGHCTGTRYFGRRLV